MLEENNIDNLFCWICLIKGGILYKSFVGEWNGGDEDLNLPMNRYKDNTGALWQPRWGGGWEGHPGGRGHVYVYG